DAHVKFLGGRLLDLLSSEDCKIWLPKFYCGGSRKNSLYTYPDRYGVLAEVKPADHYDYSTNFYVKPSQASNVATTKTVTTTSTSLPRQEPEDMDIDSTPVPNISQREQTYPHWFRPDLPGVFGKVHEVKVYSAAVMNNTGPACGWVSVPVKEPVAIIPSPRPSPRDWFWSADLLNLLSSAECRSQLPWFHCSGEQSSGLKLHHLYSELKSNPDVNQLVRQDEFFRYNDAVFRVVASPFSEKKIEVEKAIRGS